MRFSLSWLKNFLETNKSAQEIADHLNKIGLEVEELIDRTNELKPFIIAEVNECEKHPDSEKLNLCKVNNGKEILQIICGANNVSKGKKVVLAQVGTYIPGANITIKQAKIRGVESNGMLCSAEELGIFASSDSDGIIILDDNAEVGKVFIEAYPEYCDPIFDIATTPNRPDWLGIYSIARDLAACGVGKLIQLDESNVYSLEKNPKQILIEKNSGCSSIILYKLEEITNAESPKWLVNCLSSAGISSKNAMVDITNYFNISFARPLHVYDASKIIGEFTVRNAIADEKLNALDGKEYSLSSQDCIIADEQKPLAIAGIIGGEKSSCSLDSKSIYLECANFNAEKISASASRLQIETDSKQRFEKGIDEARSAIFANLAIKMMQNICGGKITEFIFSEEIKPKENQELTISQEQINLIAGFEIAIDESIQILTNLGFKVQKNANLLSVTAPSWRKDIFIWQNLAEEILRIKGFDNIPAFYHKKDQHVQSPTSDYFLEPEKLQQEYKIRKQLSANACCELITWSFISDNALNLFGMKAIKISNPISSELSNLRPSFIPSHVFAVEKNQNRSIDSISTFEIGAVFDPENLKESKKVIVLRSGKYLDRNIFEKERVFDLHDLKSDLSLILQIYNIDESQISFETDNLPTYLHPGKSAIVKLFKETLGVIGQIHPRILKHLDLTSKPFVLELDIDKLKARKKQAITISDLQPITRDFAFILNKNIKVGDVISSVKKAETSLITSVNLFDIYEGDLVGNQKKSVAFSVKLQPTNKSLNSEEINSISDIIINIVSSKFGGVLRV